MRHVTAQPKEGRLHCRGGTIVFPPIACLQISDLLKAINAAENLLEQCPAFQTFDRNGLTMSLQYFKAENLPPTLMDWCFELVKTNMEELYVPVWGWSDKKKRQELTDSASRFIIAFEDGQSDKPAAFINCRCVGLRRLKKSRGWLLASAACVSGGMRCTPASSCPRCAGCPKIYMASTFALHLPV